MPKEIRINISGQWKKVLSGKIRISGSWKTIKEGWVKVLGQWKQFFSSENVPSIAQQVTITQSTPDALDGLITLTGTNYSWTDFVSLTYYFEWSADGGSTWTTINTGSITNPSSGSFNQKFYTVTVANTSPNIDNLYRFRVFAQNVTLTNSSTSTSTTISTPRNITNVSASQVGSSLQASLSFTPGLYTNSIRVLVNRYNGAILEGSSTTDISSASPATITLPSYNKTYKFRLTPYTQTLISGNIRGYPGNQTAETAGLVIGAAPAPTQKAGKKPTLSSTGSVSAGTILTATGGEYDNVNGSISTRVYGWYPAPSVSDGTTINPAPNQSSGSTSSLTTTQTMTNYVFYAVDLVPGLDGNTYYWFSTLSATVFLPSFFDNFDRPATTGSEGIGRTSTGNWYWSNDMSDTYGYQMPVNNLNGISWQIDNEEISQRKTAYVSSNPSAGASASDYPLKSIDVGDSNVSLKVAVADGGGGPGLAFWVTASGSWWAVVPNYNSNNVTTYPCDDGPFTHTSKDCPTTYPGSTTVGQICSCTDGTTTTGTACNDGPYSHTSTTCPATTPGSTTVGVICSCTDGSTTTDCNGTRVHYNSNTDATLSCGSCTITQTANHYQNCPTPTTASPKYSNNTLGTGCGDKCSCLGPYTENIVTGSTCGTTETERYLPESVVNCNNLTSNIGKPCSQRIVSTNEGTIYYIKYCVATTTPSTYYHCTTRTCSDSWSCTYRSVTTNASYYKVGTTSTTTNASYYKVRKVDTLTYYSKISILSSVGSSVTSIASETVATSTSSYTPIYGLSVETANNTITAKAYSNLAITNQLGSTLEHTASSPQKILAGRSAVGIINSPTTANRIAGNRLDNFTYTNV